MIRLDNVTKVYKDSVKALVEVSLEIGTAVARVAWDRGLTDQPRPADLRGFVASRMYQPIYPTYAADRA